MKYVTIITLGVLIIALLASLGATPRYSWSLGDVSLGTEASPTQTWFHVGSHTVISNTVNAAGQRAAASGNVLLSPQSAADFSLNAVPDTLTMKPGNSGSSSIQLSSLEGFSGDIQFTVMVLPPGPSAELNPGVDSLMPGGTNSSILTVSTTPSTAQGMYNVSIDARSSSSEHSVSVSVNVTLSPPPSNNPPSLTVPGPESVTAGSPLEFTVTATDPDMGETVTLNATVLPSGASFNQATGQFSWTPSPSQTGNYNVTFTATDNSTPPLSDTKTVTIKVEVPPTSSPPQPSQGQTCLWCDVTSFIGTNLWLIGVGVLGGFLAAFAGSHLRSRSRLPRDRVVERSLRIPDSYKPEEETGP